MKRLVLFHNFRASCGIAPHVGYHLSALRNLASHLVLISNSPLLADRNDADTLCDEVIERPNTGFDFGAWADYIRCHDLAEYDEVLLTNSGLIGPLCDLSPLMTEMASRDCDFWGLTRNNQFRPHLQSFFLVFRKSAIRSPVWASFWDGVENWPDKWDVILNCEVILTERFEAAGLTSDSFLPVLDRGSRRYNPTVRHADTIVASGFPYIKAALLNPRSFAPVRRCAVGWQEYGC